MKKILFFLTLAVSIGLGISGYYYHMLKEKINVKVISIFQTGTFSNYDEAMLSSDSKAKIFYDGKIYHVYDSIVSSKKAKSKMIDFYDKNNIKYDVKEKYVSNNIYNSIDSYSKLIELSDNETLKIINKQVIDKYGADIIWLI